MNQKSDPVCFGIFPFKSIQLIPRDNESAADFCERVADTCHAKGYKVVKAACFGSLEGWRDFETLLRSRITYWFPLTWIDGAACGTHIFNGVQIWLAESPGLKLIPAGIEGDVIVYEDENARYLYMGNLLSRKGVDRGDSFRQLLENAEALLLSAGFSFTDVIRTWYYVDGILDWYDAFNETRTAFFKSRRIQEGYYPASTGVGGKNMLSAPVAMDLLACKPKAGYSGVHFIKSALQPEASDYGSSFSRGVRIATRHGEWMSLSGTAAIAPDGKTTSIHDFEGQVMFTLDVVRKILTREGFTPEETVRSTAYVRNLPGKRELDFLKSVMKGYGFPQGVVTRNDICRDDLLYEMELDVIKRIQ